MPTKLLDKAAKSTLRIMIGQILDGYCRDCEFYAYHVKTFSREEASAICHNQCSVGKKLQLLGEALEKGEINQEIIKMQIEQPTLNEEQIEKLNRIREEIKRKKLITEAKNKGVTIVNKEMLAKDLASGKSHKEIADLYGLKQSTVKKYVSKWGLSKPREKKMTDSIHAKLKNALKHIDKAGLEDLKNIQAYLNQLIEYVEGENNAAQG